MTKLEIIKENKARYEQVSLQIPNMTGIERAVAEHVTLAWIKGADGKFLGGLGAGKYGERAYQRAMNCGYTFEEVYDEFTRQAEIWG